MPPINCENMTGDVCVTGIVPPKGGGYIEYAYVVAPVISPVQFTVIPVDVTAPSVMAVGLTGLCLGVTKRTVCVPVSDTYILPLVSVDIP